MTIDLVTPERWHEDGRWQVAESPHTDDVKMHILPVRWPKAGAATWHLHHYVGLKQVMGAVRPNLIHLWQEPWSLVTLQALNLRNRYFPTTPIVLEVDQNILKRLPPPFEQIRRHVLSQTSYVLGRSIEATRVVKACGYSGPHGLIGYGIDQSVFHPIERESARAAFAFNEFTVGYVGRLIEEKGVDDLIDAIALTAAPISLAIMGDGPYRRALVQRAAALGVADRVRFWSWGATRDVARFMGALDVLALLTRTTKTVREQFGRVIIEAQACGTPVIGSCCGAIPDVVGEGGWIVSERNPRAVATILDRCLSRGPEWQATRLRALKHVAERFNYLAVANTLASAWWHAHQTNVGLGDELGCHTAHGHNHRATTP